MLAEKRYKIMKKELVKDWINTKLAIIYGRRFSLDRKFRNKKAVAKIHFVKDRDEKYGGSITIIMDGMIYYFEGIPQIKQYKNRTGKNVVQKTLKYGGWEMNMIDKANKLF